MFMPNSTVSVGGGIDIALACARYVKVQRSDETQSRVAFGICLLRSLGSHAFSTTLNTSHDMIHDTDGGASARYIRMIAVKLFAAHRTAHPGWLLDVE